MLIDPHILNTYPRVFFFPKSTEATNLLNVTMRKLYVNKVLKNKNLISNHYNYLEGKMTQGYTPSQWQLIFSYLLYKMNQKLLIWTAAFFRKLIYVSHKVESNDKQSRRMEPLNA